MNKIQYQSVKNKRNESENENMTITWALNVWTTLISTQK